MAIEAFTINTLYMVFNKFALPFILCLLSCGSVPKAVKQSFTLRYSTDTSNIPTTVYHMKYSTLSKNGSWEKNAYDTFKNESNFILYKDFTFISGFSYKILGNKKYVFGDWGIWTQKGDTIFAQYLNDAREKFNKTFYVRQEIFLLKNNIVISYLGAYNLLHPQPEDKFGIVPGTVIIKSIEPDSIPPPDSWLKTQEWIYK